MEIRLKQKYRSAQRSRYTSKHNDGKRRGISRKKTGVQPNLPGVRTMVVLPTGKIRMEWINV